MKLYTVLLALTGPVFGARSCDRNASDPIRWHKSDHLRMIGIWNHNLWASPDQRASSCKNCTDPKRSTSNFATRSIGPPPPSEWQLRWIDGRRRASTSSHEMWLTYRARWCIATACEKPWLNNSLHYYFEKSTKSWEAAFGEANKLVLFLTFWKKSWKLCSIHFCQISSVHCFIKIFQWEPRKPMSLEGRL
jgi:hypothetical protein